MKVTRTRIGAIDTSEFHGAPEDRSVETGGYRHVGMVGDRVDMRFAGKTIPQENVNTLDELQATIANAHGLEDLERIVTDTQHAPAIIAERARQIAEERAESAELASVIDSSSVGQAAIAAGLVPLSRQFDEFEAALGPKRPRRLDNFARSAEATFGRGK